jgi:alpha-L-fucosidase
MKKILQLFTLILLTFFQTGFSQTGYVPSADNMKNREWFHDAKFGLFIHWGVYSLLGSGEWVMQQKQISKEDYQELPEFFNPIDFNPKEWVAIAKAAGMKYITITTRHHDGFSMFATKQTDWNIMDRTPYKKDVIKMLADECHKQGIKLFLYYSHLDWYQNDYFPRGNTGQYSGRPDSGNWNKYLGFINAQLTELLTNYGEISGIWFDGMWDKRNADWQLDKTYNLIHSLQPGCMIGNNHHLSPNPGEDFQMFEKDLPGKNTTGFNAESKIGSLPLETCETMNDSWGFNLSDNNFKSVKTLVQYLVKAAGNNANFLLNIGPMPNGKIHPRFISTLKEIGKWLEKNGETIYGTNEGPVPQKSWGVTTQKGHEVFIHILSLESQNLLIPDFGKKIKSIKLFSNGSEIKFKQDEFGIAVQIPEDKTDNLDTILILDV